jgi:hypothetical protein
MELSPSWEAANCAAAWELPSILWNPEVHHRVHISSPPVPILSQIDPILTIPSYLRSISILSTHLRLGLPSGLFWLSHQYPICIPPLPHSCYIQNAILFGSEILCNWETEVHSPFICLSRLLVYKAFKGEEMGFITKGVANMVLWVTWPLCKGLIYNGGIAVDLRVPCTHIWFA